MCCQQPPSQTRRGAQLRADVSSTMPGLSCAIPNGTAPLHLSVTMSSTAPIVDVWLNALAALPSSSSQTKLHVVAGGGGSASVWRAGGAAGGRGPANADTRRRLASPQKVGDTARHWVGERHMKRVQRACDADVACGGQPWHAGEHRCCGANAAPCDGRRSSLGARGPCGAAACQATYEVGYIHINVLVAAEEGVQALIQGELDPRLLRCSPCRVCRRILRMCVTFLHVVLPPASRSVPRGHGGD